MGLKKFSHARIVFKTLAAFLGPVGVITAVFWVTGLLWALKFSPPDYQQGEAMRMMYVHVPASWLACGIYLMMALASLIFLIWRLPLADIAAESCAPLGFTFTGISLVTGAIWGKPMWGTWWVWDARLTSMLMLFFLYGGYMALRHGFLHPLQAQRPAAFLALCGAINIPIIKGSVVWWNTLHQPASVLRLKGPSIHWEMLGPLLVMTVAFFGTFFLLFLVRMQEALLNRKITAQHTRLTQ